MDLYPLDTPSQQMAKCTDPDCECTNTTSPFSWEDRLHKMGWLVGYSGETPNPAHEDDLNYLLGQGHGHQDS
jgi:hypothetical protein